MRSETIFLSSSGVDLAEVVGLELGEFDEAQLLDQALYELDVAGQFVGLADRRSSQGQESGDPCDDAEPCLHVWG